MKTHIMLKGFKYRIYPTADQAVLINKHIGCSRFIYNWALEQRAKAWNSEKKTLNRFKINNLITSLKKNDEYSWLREVNSQTLQGASDDLDKAFNSFFQKKNKYPTFKSKHCSKQSFRVPQHAVVDQDNGLLHLPKFSEPIKIVISRRFNGHILNVTISRTPTGKYYASVLVDTGVPAKPCKKINVKTAIGLDLGIKDFVAASDGRKFSNPKALYKHERKLKKLQHKASRKVKGSNNRHKANLRTAKVYEKISNIRNDFQHKLSYQLTHENQVGTIAIEDLSVSNMLKNHKLARAISDCGWSSFVNKLTYKCEWYGINLITIGRFEPSSKLCSHCGAINHDLKLSDREWTCTSCNTHHDRDVNAAKNIKSFGLNPKQSKIRSERSKLTLGESRRSNATHLTQESPTLR
jgi:putative transposase